MYKIIIFLVLLVCYVYSQVEEVKELSSSTADVEKEKKEDGLRHQADKPNNTKLELGKEEYEEDDEHSEYEVEKSEGIVLLDDQLHLDDEEEIDDTLGIDQEVIQRPLRALMRCSRRFTTGVCYPPVGAVWTYEFDKQNCTERLGCPESDERANRFKSYQNCQIMCQSLGSVYSKVLDHHEHIDGNRRSGGLPDDKKVNKDFTDLPPLSESYSDNEKRPLARQYHDYMERRRSFSYDDYSMPAGAGDLVPIDLDDPKMQPEVWGSLRRNFN